MQKPDISRTVFIQALNLTRDLASQPNTKDREKEILEYELDVLEKNFESLKKKIALWKKLDQLKQFHKQQQLQFCEKVKLLHKIQDKLEQTVEEDHKSGLINFAHQEGVLASEILLYACKISNFVQAHPKYSANDGMMPWSFGLNKVENEEIYNSGLYFMYKNNPNYEICSPPEVIYLNNSNKNIESFKMEAPFVFAVTLRGNLHIRPQVGQGEQFVYTMDGSIPNKFFRLEGQIDLITVDEDCQLRLRSYKAGLIDSPILHYKFKVVEKKESNVAGLNNMERPKDELASYSSSENSDNGEIDLFGGTLFSSIHDQNIMATPNTLLDESDEEADASPFN